MDPLGPETRLDTNVGYRPSDMTRCCLTLRTDFGYLDGISQPAITGWAMDVLPGQSIIPTGVILTGRLGDLTPRPAWAVDGSFMVFRHLQQKVPEFTAYTRANALARTSAGIPLTTEQGAEFLGARMFGRWKSGAPIDLAPFADNPTLGADPQRNNHFDFNSLLAVPSIDQSRCPFSAHVRKANPRSDLLDVDTTNHAIRAGTPYCPEVSAAEASSGTTTQDRGLAFGASQPACAPVIMYLIYTWQSNISRPLGTDSGSNK